jgi:hypothetical protein
MKKRLIAAAFLLALSAAPAFAQGCAMCYQSAEQAGHKAQTALQHGILMLLIPTLSVMGGLACATVYFRHPNSSGAAEPFFGDAALPDDFAAREFFEEDLEEERV